MDKITVRRWLILPLVALGAYTLAVYPVGLLLLMLFQVENIPPLVLIWLMYLQPIPCVAFAIFVTRRVARALETSGLAG